MISIKKHNSLIWVDLESPTTEELESVGQEFNINQHTLRELKYPSDKPKVDVFNNFLYLILHFPKYGYGSKRDSIEIDFVLGKDFLITAHYTPSDPINSFSKAFETSSTLNKFDLESGGQIFFYLIKEIYKNTEEELIYIEGKLQEIEGTIFSENGEKILENLSRLNKELIDFRRIMRGHKEVFDSLEVSAAEFFGPQFSHYSNTLMGNRERVWNILEGNRETLLDLRQTSDSLFSARTNSIVRTLTILTFISIPISLIANIMGVNAENIPIVGHKFDFWLIWILMSAIAAVMLIFFRFKKWL
ncbi:MAG TPA: magnesium transporter CorA family protein [Candidatus Paceibacterota bacterium]|nr:magnesium transporter CorA family protein [Candidatus Paceibacterota bacterium]